MDHFVNVNSNGTTTISPRSLIHFYITASFTKMDKTYWTHRYKDMEGTIFGILLLI